MTVSPKWLDGVFQVCSWGWQARAVIGCMFGVFGVLQVVQVLSEQELDSRDGTLQGVRPLHE